MSRGQILTAVKEQLEYLDGLPFPEREREEARITEVVRTAGVAQVNPAGQERVSPNRVSPSPIWREFPTDELPESVATFVREVASAIGCDESMVALPVLASLGGCIGNRRRIRLKRSWTEPAVVWAVVVARSGTRKSPAMAEVTRSLRRREAEKIDAASQRQAAHELELQSWKDQAASQRGDRPPEPEPCVRTLVSDTTVEALTLRLSESRAGLLVVRDELAGWIRSFDSYKGGKGGDVQHWLEMHRAGAVIVDRKTGQTLSVPRAAVSIIGTIQPGVLRQVLEGEHMVNGLAARLLFAMPPQRSKRWSDADVSAETRAAWDDRLEELIALPYEGEPLDLPLTPSAHARFVEFYNEHAERQEEAENEVVAAAFSKLEGYAARLALIVELSGNPHAKAVEFASMEAGIRLADWFANEAERIYAAFQEAPEERDRRQLVDLIAARGGSVTERDLARGPRRYRDPGAAAIALEDLAASGFGSWHESLPEGGGHTVRVFSLYGIGDGDTRPPNDALESGDTRPAKSRSACVASGDTRPNEPKPSVAVATAGNTKTQEEDL